MEAGRLRTGLVSWLLGNLSSPQPVAQLPTWGPTPLFAFMYNYGHSNSHCVELADQMKTEDAPRALPRAGLDEMKSRDETGLRTYGQCARLSASQN